MQTENTSWWQALILVLTNLVGIWPVYLAFRYEYYFTGVNVVVSILASGFHHMCPGFGCTTAEIEYVFEILDHYKANDLILVTILLLMFPSRRNKNKYWVYAAFSSAILILILLGPRIVWFRVAIYALLGGLVLVQYLRIVAKEVVPPVRIDPADGYFTLVLGLIAILFIFLAYVLPDQYYWIFHSLWHVFVYAALSFAIHMSIPGALVKFKRLVSPVV